MKKRRYKHRFRTLYRLECRYRGQDEVLDRLLIRIVGRVPDAVGFDYVKQERNMNWIFPNRKAASLTQERVASTLGQKIQCQTDTEIQKIDCLIRHANKERVRTRHRG